jgi:hypothetical protein
MNPSHWRQYGTYANRSPLWTLRIPHYAANIENCLDRYFDFSLTTPRYNRKMPVIALKGNRTFRVSNTRLNLMPPQQPRIPKPIDPLMTFCLGACIGADTVAHFLPIKLMLLHVGRSPIIAAIAFTPMLLRYLYRRWRYRASRSPRSAQPAV